MVQNRLALQCLQLLRVGTSLHHPYVCTYSVIRLNVINLDIPLGEGVKVCLLLLSAYIDSVGINGGHLI